MIFTLFGVTRGEGWVINCYVATLRSHLDNTSYNVITTPQLYIRQLHAEEFPPSLSILFVDTPSFSI